MTKSLHELEQDFQEAVRKATEEIRQLEPASLIEYVSDAAYWRIIARYFHYKYNWVNLATLGSDQLPPHSPKEVILDEIQTAVSIDCPEAT